MSMGASKVVGVDISEDVIDKARMKKGEGEYFATGDAQEIKDLLIEKHGEVDLMLGSQFEIGAFDLCTAVFLFNYMSINSMRTTMRQVFSLLKPGGEFVFSVPHPNMVQHHSTKFAFDGSGDGYFSMRDRVLNGRIHTADGTTLNVHMVFKTLEDYISAITSLGFVLVEMKEARVDGMDQLLSSASDVPLHLIFRVKKPSSVSENASLSSTIGVDAMPKSLIWSKMAKCNFESFIRLDLPEAVNKELCEAALKCYENNVPIDSVTIGRDVRTKDLSALRSFCAKASNKMRQSTGALLIKGLDMEILGGDEDYEKMEKCGKIAYYIFCEHMGTVDGAARGKLFDVKSAKLDAMCQTGGDNVLFSVSDIEAGWHTDGASKDRVYDIVALFCINQAHSGGKFKISNACNAYHDLLACLPDFLTYELQRPIPRDILENGAGKGSDDTTALSRAAPVLANRIRYNAYPIYSLDNDRMRFRYMRHWIETGHKKTDWKVPTLLRIAMDVLDDKLDASKTFNQRLERGDMIFANNALIAHARDSFKDHPDHRPRHLVRAWIQSH
jgi:SAM-dependent methyltransferase/alpha-ketoglutarate-dependent taurine dioxygenase